MNVVNGWRTTTLGEVADLVGGGTPSRKDPTLFGRDIDWVTPSDLAPIGEVRSLGRTAEGLSAKGLADSSVKRLPAGTVLFSSRASIGKIAVTDRECCTNQGFANFVPRPGVVDPWFLAYFLAHTTTDITALAGETTFKEIARGRLREFQFIHPSLDEQRRIVGRIKECVERVDEIERLRREARKEAVILELAAFHDTLIEGVEQRNWLMGTLNDVAHSFRYGTSAKAHSDEVGTPVLRMGNIANGYLDYTDLKYIELSEKELNKYRLKLGDILINRTNSLELVGKAAVFDRKRGDWVYASYLVAVDVDRSRVEPQFVAAVLNSRMGRDFVAATARRAIGMVNINAKEMARFPMPLPPVSEQREIVRTLKAVRDSAESLRLELTEPAVTHLRAAVLRKAFVGDL